MMITDARGMEGMILYNHATKKHYLRVKRADGFKDYAIWHEDLMVKITDTDAFFYDENGNCRIDTSPSTLGLEVQNVE